MEEGHRSAGEEEAHHPEGVVGAPSQMVVEVEEAGFRQNHSSGKEHPDREEGQQQPQGRRSREHHSREHRNQ